MSNRGVLLVLSGASGSGKGTILSEYLARHEDTVVSISVTTRNPRPGEQDGVQYFFRTKEQAEQMIADNLFLEYASYNGEYYGTPRQPVEQWLDSGKNVVLEIEVQGARQVMEREKELISVFIMPPSLAVLEQRLRGRKTETEEQIQSRLAIAQSEMTQSSLYNYIVINDDLDKAVQDLEHIIETEKQKRGNAAE